MPEPADALPRSAAEELLDRITASTLSDADQDLVLAATEGAESLGAHLRGESTPTSPDDAVADRPAPSPLVYLEEIAVEGFRGIGERRRLQLAAGPGLTLVVGRNGSGKSSFAEGLEVLLTGTTSRWEERAKVWREGWRNLHRDGLTSVSARLRIDGSTQPIQLTRTWPAGAALDSVTETRVTGAAASWSELGWQRALEQFRPILSYNELGTMFSTRAAALYDALSAILGLEAFDAVLATLRDERLRRAKTEKHAKATRVELRGRLSDSEDPRAQAVATLLTPRVPDLDTIAGHLTEPERERTAGPEGVLAAIELPTPELIDATIDQVTSTAADLHALRSTDAAEVDALASLLEAGLRLHEHRRTDDLADCPLCGAAGTIDAGWAMRTDAAAQDLRARSRELREAETRLRDAKAELRGLFAPRLATAIAGGEHPDLDTAPAQQAWADWIRAVEQPTDPQPVRDAAVALRDALVALRVTAREMEAARVSAWQPQLEAIAAWVALAREARRDHEIIERLKRAEAWMGETLVALRRDRMAPIVTGARANWDLLRHESNVALGDVDLKKQGNVRYAAFDVTIDGTDASALGVMSQGELSALGICVFLPRALLAGSPFGFVVIDDPVQSMDPAKVDGLARVLAGAAATRQVVVFTHDDRLPEAVHRLGIDARVMEVKRRARSDLEITAGRPASERYLGEAASLCRGDQVPPEVIAHVVPGFCRSAIEAACEERIRRQRVAAGASHARVDAELAELTSLRSWLSATFGLTQAQGRELRERVTHIGGDGAMTVVDLASKGGHGPLDGIAPEDLVRGTRRLVEALERP